MKMMMMQANQMTQPISHLMTPMMTTHLIKENQTIAMMMMVTLLVMMRRTAVTHILTQIPMMATMTAGE